MGLIRLGTPSSSKDPAPILMRLATHKDLATTQRYIDIADADLLAAADKTESLIEQQLRAVT